MVTPNRARIEVDNWTAGSRRTTVAYIDLDLEERVRAIGIPLLEELIAEVRAITGLGRGDALCLLMCQAVEQSADVAAYEREAERRGVLAL